MRLQDVQAELRRALAEAGPGGIVSWHDPSEEFANRLDELDLDGARLLREEPGGLFALKRLLNAETSSTTLLYRPGDPSLSGDWLADVEARARRFSADYASVLLRDLGAPDNPQMRAHLRERRAFLAKRANVKALRKLREGYANPRQLDVAIMAAALGADAATPEAILRAYLLKGACEDGVNGMGTNERDGGRAGADDGRPGTGGADSPRLSLDDVSPNPFAILDAAGVAASFAQAVVSWCGYPSDASDARALAHHVLLAASAQAMPARMTEVLHGLGLPRELTRTQLGLCHSIFVEWASSPGRRYLLRLCHEIEGELGMEAALGTVDPNELEGANVFPCVDAVILRSLLARVAMGPNDAASILACVNARRARTWHEVFAPFYQGVECAANMQVIYGNEADRLTAMDPVRVWELYTGELWRMDQWYRKLHVAFARALGEWAYDDLAEAFRACCAHMERLYKGWFLRELNRRWVEGASEQLGATGRVTGLAQQVDFALTRVEPLAHARTRVWVIVSDALRYEVAAELAQHLERDTRGSCELASMQAAFPSITKCGMTALLPAGSFSLATSEAGGRSRVAVLADGSEVAGCAARQRVLRTRYPHAVAITYDDFVREMDRDQRRALVADAEVVYVYHNVIDAIGDKAPTERRTFLACEEAIGELAGLVNLIAREHRASDVLVTADHGFLYTDEPLAESEHASLSDLGGDVVEGGKRWAVTRGDADGGPLVRVAVPSAESLVGWAPRGCVRIRMAGGGENFVHGGISLQELCVPVLSFHNHRAGSRGYVESRHASLVLVSAPQVIANPVFAVEVLQAEAIGGKVLPARYGVYVSGSDGEPVTDMGGVVADRTGDDATTRTTRMTLALRPGVATSQDAVYHLCAHCEETGKETVLRDVRIQVEDTGLEDIGW